jgi:hypothetical protein
MDARVRTKFPATGVSGVALSYGVGGAEPAPIATPKTLPRQQSLPRLTDYHRRCLRKRLGECHEALAQAMSALSQAQAWQPGDQSLDEMFELVRAAHGLTYLAQRVGGAVTEANLGAGMEDPGVSRSHENHEAISLTKLRQQPLSACANLKESQNSGASEGCRKKGSIVPASRGFFPPRGRTEPRTPANADAPSDV